MGEMDGMEKFGHMTLVYISMVEHGKQSLLLSYKIEQDTQDGCHQIKIHISWSMAMAMMKQKFWILKNKIIDWVFN